ncbi:MAG TPA: septal ring lytic transglycosylase RlpA family protein [Thermoanaerobaculia bacterium]|nr:septal ring lytic transglycosylase RlpA family protein [Thermoanaerobaculia bacterium]
MRERAEGRGLRAEGTAARVAVCSVLLVLAYGCATTAPPTREEMEPLRGIASWYGEEFSGRTTANGEIFDPGQLTAAHRTLPFGSILDVTNPRTGQIVRVRVNDRGPYIGGRILDLSYAAAQKIGLIEPGIGEVEIKVVKIGSGDKEPPQPFGVTVAEAPKSVPVIPEASPAKPEVHAAAPAPPAAENKAPDVEFPLPAEKAGTPAPIAVNEPVVTEEPVAREERSPRQEPVVVDRVVVETQRAGVPTRKQVGADGRTIEEVPVDGAAPSTPTTATRTPSTKPAAPSRPAAPQFFVQVGAFSVEANAIALQERLTAIGLRAFIDRSNLFRVRIGPFAKREQAVDARERLEAEGVSAIIVAE